MSVSGVFKRPILRLRKGTCLYPYEGFKANLGPYRGPSRLKLGALVPKELEFRARRLLRNLVFGVKGYGGLAKWFDCWVEWPPKLIVGDYFSFPSLVKEFHGVDVVLVFIPDEHYYGYEEDPYIPVKQSFALEGIPSQMVTTSTLKRLADKSYVLFNLALSVYSKAGGVPWILAEPLYADVYIGIDTVSTGVAVTILSSNDGMYFNWYTGLNPDVEVIRTLGEVLKSALSSSEYLIEGVERVVIHRDGRCFEEEVEAVKDVIGWGIIKGIFNSDVEWSLMEIRKRIVPRVIGRRFNRFVNPEKGVFYALGPHEYLVVTVGFPEHPYITQSGLVRPIIVELVEASTWEVDMRKLVRDVYWLSELHWASAFSSVSYTHLTLPTTERV